MPWRPGRPATILAMIEEGRVSASVGMKMTRLSQAQAEGFYAVHRERPFFIGLVKFMTEGPVIVMVLEREDAIKKWRELMGATNPANAAEGTIRKRFAENIERNAVHGSDAPETAAIEIPFFFAGSELLYVELTEPEREELKRSSSRTLPAGDVFEAKLIFALLAERCRFTAGSNRN